MSTTPALPPPSPSGSRPPRCDRAHLLTAALAALLLAGVCAPADAQDLQAGDIVVPGVRVIDGFGNTNGCFYRLRSGTVTRVFETSAFRAPRDMMVDAAGRLVFFATPASRNINDTALFRLDPSTGILERLFYFPYIVAPGDTLPGGASNATGFYGVPQSLHLEQRFEITIDDDENGGWPQVETGRFYGFAIGTSVAGGRAPTTYRYNAVDGSCEEGVSSALLPWTSAPYMAADDKFVYYGLNNIVGRVGLPMKLDLHLDGDWGVFDFSAQLPPKNELIITGTVFDNTRYPNGTVQCGPLIDSNVPFTGGGSTFNVLSMDGLGVLDGSLYATSPSGATGTPYVFNVAPREPYLNPYVCLWDTAVEGTGLLDFYLLDGTPTAAALTSPDGGGVLGLGNGVVKRADPAGGFQVLDSSQPYSGRPWRWHGASAAPMVTQAAPDSGAQLLVVRVDTLAYVMLTDSQGRRVGHDAAGAPVNDFGESAQLLSSGAGGWPRLIVLRDPPNEVLRAEIAAAAAGDWAVRAYLAHEGGGTKLAPTLGSAGGAGSVLRGLYVGQPALLTWFDDPIVGIGEPTGAAGIGFVSVGPVPSRGEVRFVYRVPGSGARVRLDVFDIAGRLVTTPVAGLMSSGTHTITWRGDGPSGARLATGVYLASLIVDGRRETRRVVLTD